MSIPFLIQTDSVTQLGHLLVMDCLTQPMALVLHPAGGKHASGSFGSSGI